MLEFIGLAVVAVLVHVFMMDDGPKQIVVLLAEEDGSTGSVVVSSGDQTLSLDQAGQATEFSVSKPPSEAYVLSADRISSLFGDALAAQPKLPRQFLLYFQHNSNDLVPDSAAALPEILYEIKERPVPQIVIIGHTDTKGSTSYNQQLGFERAQLIYDAIVSIGADPSQIRIESHGESNLLVNTPDDVLEPKNRRVEVSVR